MSEPGRLRERVLVAVYEKSHGKLTNTDGLVDQLGVNRVAFTAVCGELERLGLAKPRFRFDPEWRFPGLIELTDQGLRRAEQLLR
ncbi:helix-turn-helix domain-containing protein [Streptacidiphilus fuscans]|uniref:Uncharacterized protein n=1 Tax=Streptacidiphilus fuscans TaxID=2789292 RepID=A0A931BFG9_9ACTN|nr:hypothetical protein [Streptacidiphilus fuscans]MBF9073163.1 hypothetical protein [Streptacidiphilus fuscans]